MKLFIYRMYRDDSEHHEEVVVLAEDRKDAVKTIEEGIREAKRVLNATGIAAHAVLQYRLTRLRERLTDDGEHAFHAKHGLRIEECDIVRGVAFITP